MIIDRRLQRRACTGLACVGLLAIPSSIGLADGVPAATTPAPPSVIVTLAPVRILDTRAGLGAPAAPVEPGKVITLQVTGQGGVPTGATGVVLNLTATAADGAGYVTAFPADRDRPEASVLNYSPGLDAANMITASLSPDGALTLYNANGTVHLLADVAGYLVPGDGVPGSQGPPGPGAISINTTVTTPPWIPGSSGHLPEPVPIATSGGVNLSVVCYPTEFSLDFDAGSGNALFAGEIVRGTASEQVNGPISRILSPVTDSIYVSGIVQNTSLGQVFHLELIVNPPGPEPGTSSCFTWGIATPST